MFKLKKRLLSLASAAFLMGGVGGALSIVIESPQPAQAACANWLCGWEGSLTAGTDTAEDKKLISRNFLYIRSLVVVVILGLLAGAFFGREDKERMTWFLGASGTVVVVALFLNVIIGYVFGDGGAKTALLPQKSNQVVAILVIYENDQI
jgi:energy-converting hydrogenase Eha subunit A